MKYLKSLMTAHAGAPLLFSIVMSSCGGGGSSDTVTTAVSASTASGTSATTGASTTLPTTTTPPAVPTTTTPATDATTPVATASALGLPFVKTAAIPSTLPGYPTDRVQPTTEVAPDSDIGAFRTTCTFSHMSFDDPIVYPGQPGKSHLHAFFGNTGTNANSTAASIASTGDSTCRGGTVNRSAYWVPALIDTADGTPLAPTDIGPYYKTGYFGVQAKDIQPLPQGLRMISGDSTASAGQSMARWQCDLDDGTDSGNRSEIPGNCKPGSVLSMVVDFPQCWDGVNLDSPDHKSHMAFANGQVYITQAQLDARVAAGGPLPAGFQNNLGLQWWEVISTTTACPSTHPVALATIEFGIHYLVPSTPKATAKWRLSSDNYDTTKPGGYSAHGDWMNGWKKDASDSWAINCDRAKKDCHSHLLGDGRMMY